MVHSPYDKIVLSHYKEVAEKKGHDATSTMEDVRVREMETEIILKFVTQVRSVLLAAGRREEDITLVDVGCGNGFTLSQLYERLPRFRYIGIEYTPELRAVAAKRFEFLENGRVETRPGDIRQLDGLVADISICQRVIINLLDRKDQSQALRNIRSMVHKGGFLFFIEAFSSGLRQLNEARAEFDLEPIPEAYHNLYLNDDFFESEPNLRPFVTETYNCDKNFLSTHYFVSRVFHPVMLRNREFKRNSHWVSFFSQALAQNVGDYSPLRAFAFQKVQ